MEHERNRVPLDDEEIVELYWQREERAIRETDAKYGSYLNTVALHIVHDALDCEECLNDTYIGAWNAMPPSRPQALKAFLTTIMRRVAVNRYHKNALKKHVPSEMTVSLSELGELWSDSTDVERSLTLRDTGSPIPRDLTHTRQKCLAKLGWKDAVNALIRGVLTALQISPFLKLIQCSCDRAFIQAKPLGKLLLRQSRSSSDRQQKAMMAGAKLLV